MSDVRARIDSLSPRQREILIYVAQHLSSKEIGLRLGLRPATVDSHIAAALQRLQLASRREAGALMIELAYTRGLPDRDAQPAKAHHGDDLDTRRHQLPPIPRQSIFWRLIRINRLPGSRESLRESEGESDEKSIRRTRSGMGQVVLRCILDSFYITLFFSIISAAAYGAHRIVEQCEQAHIDATVLVVLKIISYCLVGLDGIGVIAATALLIWRFIRAVAVAND